MKKKRAYKKRTAKRRGRPPGTGPMRVKLGGTQAVDLRMPKNVASFLVGASEASSLPLDVIINSLLAVQVHAMREKR